jgi:hypothetical protein
MKVVPFDFIFNLTKFGKLWNYGHTLFIIIKFESVWLLEKSQSNGKWIRWTRPISTVRSGWTWPKAHLRDFFSARARPAFRPRRPPSDQSPLVSTATPATCASSPPLSSVSFKRHRKNLVSLLLLPAPPRALTNTAPLCPAHQSVTPKCHCYLPRSASLPTTATSFGSLLIESSSIARS